MAPGKKQKQKRPHKHKRKLDSEEQEYKREQRLTKKLKQEEHALDFAARQDRKIAAQQTLDPEAVAQAVKHKQVSAYDRLLGVLGVGDASSAASDADDFQANEASELDASEVDDEVADEVADFEDEDAELSEEADDSEASEGSEEEDNESDEEASEAAEDLAAHVGLDSFDSAGIASHPDASANFRSSGFSRVLVKGASEAQVRKLLSGGNFRSHKHMNAEAVAKLFEEGRAKEASGVISEYMDALMPGELWEVSAAHAASHVLRTRDLVIGNSGREVGDSGFARPRVLVLSATRSLADRWLRKFIEFLDERRSSNLRGLEKYERKFLGISDSEFPKSGREQMFAGNTDDNFRVGVSVSKRSVKLMSNFETSDVILASPLGLSVNDEISDCLSSLEVVVLDQADLFRFQNWEHVVRVLDASNRKPKSVNFDISRLRASFIDERQRVFRQTIVVSDRPVTEMLAVFDDRWKFPALSGNFRGRAILADEVSDSIALNLRGELGVHRQIFLSPKLAVDRKPSDTSDPRLELLRDKFWKEVGRELTRLVICVSDYFAFLRVRKFFKAETEARFAEISEFTSDRKLQLARESFESGDKPVLIITERLLWFKPLRLKNVQHVLFFGVPEYPAHYDHLVRRCVEPVRANVVTLFTPEELNQLERIVGTSQVAKVLPKIEDNFFLPKMAVFT